MYITHTHPTPPSNCPIKHHRWILTASRIRNPPYHRFEQGISATESEKPPDITSITARGVKRSKIHKEAAAHNTLKSQKRVSQATTSR